MFMVVGIYTSLMDSYGSMGTTISRPGTLPKTNMEGPKMMGLGKGNGTL